jgi:hypothetical protein
MEPLFCHLQLPPIHGWLQLYPWKGLKFFSYRSFLASKRTFSTHKTNMLFRSKGPNEYENNVQ